MNYYNRYPSHYLSKTLLLTLEQDGAYGRLMDWYYSEEKAIPHDKRYTIGRCQSSREKAAIDFVLSEFFERDGDHWIHDRIEKELMKASPKIEAARENGKRGGRPRKEKPNGLNEENPLGFQNETQNEPSAKAPQSPIPNYSVGTSEASAEIPTGQPTEAGRACQLLKQAGCARFNSSHPDLLAALREGVTPEAIRDTYLENPNKKNPFAYAIATARSRHAEGARAISTGPPSIRAQAVVPMSKTLQALHNLEAAKHAPGLDHPGDQLRIAKADFVEP